MKTRLIILASITMMLPSCGSFTQLSFDDYAYSDGIYAGGAGYRKAASEPITQRYFPTFPESLHLDPYTIIAREDLGNVTNYYFVDRWASPFWYDWYSPFRLYRWYDPWYRPFAWSRPMYWGGPGYWNDPWYWGYGPWRYDPWYWGGPGYYAWGYPGRYMPWGRPYYPYGPVGPHYGRAVIPSRPVYQTNGPRNQGGIGSGTGSGGYRSSPRTGSSSGYGTVPRSGSTSESSAGSSSGRSSWSRTPNSSSGSSSWNRNGSSSWGGGSSGAPRSSGGSSSGGGWSRGGGSSSSYNGHSGAVRR